MKQTSTGASVTDAPRTGRLSGRRVPRPWGQFRLPGAGIRDALAVLALGCLLWWADAGEASAQGREDAVFGQTLLIDYPEFVETGDGEERRRRRENREWLRRFITTTMPDSMMIRIQLLKSGLYWVKEDGETRNQFVDRFFTVADNNFPKTGGDVQLTMQSTLEGLRSARNAHRNFTNQLLQRHRLQSAGQARLRTLRVYIIGRGPNWEVRNGGNVVYPPACFEQGKGSFDLEAFGTDTDQKLEILVLSTTKREVGRQVLAMLDSLTIGRPHIRTLGQGRIACPAVLKPSAGTQATGRECTPIVDTDSLPEWEPCTDSQMQLPIPSVPYPDDTLPRTTIATPGQPDPSLRPAPDPRSPPRLSPPGASAGDQPTLVPGQAPPADRLAAQQPLQGGGPVGADPLPTRPPASSPPVVALPPPGVMADPQPPRVPGEQDSWRLVELARSTSAAACREPEIRVTSGRAGASLGGSRPGSDGQAVPSPRDRRGGRSEVVASCSPASRNAKPVNTRPIDQVLVLDFSGSMRRDDFTSKPRGKKYEVAREEALKYLDSHGRDPLRGDMSVVTFGTRTQACDDIRELKAPKGSESINLLKAEVSAMQPVEGGYTPLTDATLAAMRIVAEGDKNHRKRVVVITDGAEEPAACKRDFCGAIGPALKDCSLTLHLIGYQAERNALKTLGSCVNENRKDCVKVTSVESQDGLGKEMQAARDPYAGLERLTAAVSLGGRELEPGEFQANVSRILADGGLNPMGFDTGANSAGPYALEPGRYRVTVTVRGAEKTLDVNLADGCRTAKFDFGLSRLNLQARLPRAVALPDNSVTWHVRQKGGALADMKTGTAAAVDLEPGTYEVTLTAGTVVEKREVVLGVEADQSVQIQVVDPDTVTMEVNARHVPPLDQVLGPTGSAAPYFEIWQINGSSPLHAGRGDWKQRLKPDSYFVKIDSPWSRQTQKHLVADNQQVSVTFDLCYPEIVGSIVDVDGSALPEVAVQWVLETLGGAVVKEGKGATFGAHVFPGSYQLRVRTETSVLEELIHAKSYERYGYHVRARPRS